MAKMVLLASYLSINSNDLSGNTSKIELTAEVADEDVTTFGSGGWKEVLGGLKEGSLSVTFKQDVAASALDSIMWALFGTVVPFEVRLSNAAVGTSNPKYTGSVLVKEWKPIAGEVGSVAEVDVEFPTSGAVARAVS
ncbi:MAG: phage tail tube protein [Bacteroidales bacterium]